MITILTGSENKYLDLRSSLHPLDVTWKQLDLLEIQSLDSKKIIEYKLKEAQKFLPNQDILIDDRSLCIDALGGLPGTLVKWFLETLTVEGIFNLIKDSPNKRATAICYLGYASKNGDLAYFKGEVVGEIVPPRGTKDYGWGPIFKPLGQGKTFGEMERDEKHLRSHHGRAVEKFKDYILSQSNSPKRCALAIILDKQNRIIAQKRDDLPNIAQPGMVALFGGSAEIGETALSNIRRELLEELELIPEENALSFYKTFPSSDPLHKNSNTSSSIFVLTNVDSSKLVLHEGQEILKIPQDKLRDYNWCSECLMLVENYLAEH